MLVRLLAWLVNTFWTALAVVIIIVGLYVSLGRYYVPLVDNFREDFETQASQLLAANVRSLELTGDWREFNPVLGVNQLTVTKPSASGVSQTLLSIAEAKIELDTLRSLRAFTPVYKEAVVNGLQLHLYRNKLGAWSSPLLQGGGGSLNIEALYDAAHDLSAQRVQVLFHDVEAVHQLTIANVSLARGHNITQSILSLVDDVNDAPIEVVLESFQQARSPQFQLRGYMDGTDVDLAPYRFLFGSQLSRSDNASLELWLDWRKGQPLRIHGTAAAQQFEMDGFASIEFASANIGASLDAAGTWSLFIDKAMFGDPSSLVELPPLRFDVAPGFSSVQLSAANLDLTLTSQVSGLMAQRFQPVANILQSLQPRGFLNNLTIELASDGNVWQPRMAATLADVSADSWRGSPAISGLSGELLHTGASGRLKLSDENVQLTLAKLYPQPFSFTQLSGELWWSIAERTSLYTSNLTAHTKYGQLVSSLAVDLRGYDDAPAIPTITMSVYSEQALASVVHELIPSLKSSSDLRRWFQKADLTGEISSAAFFLHSSLDQKRSWQPTLQLLFDASDAALNYDSEWPRVSMPKSYGAVSGQLARAYAATASSFDMYISQLNVKTDVVQGSAYVNVDAIAVGDTSAALKLFQETPLADITRDAFGGWVGDGEFQATARIGLDAKNRNDVAADVYLSLRDSNLGLPEANLQFENLSGELSYRDGVLSSTGLHGLFLNEAWQGELATTEDDHYLLSVKGEARVKSIADWLQQPLLLFANGETEFDARLVFGDGVKPKLSINTELTGVAIDLPAPFRKSQSDTQNLEIQIGLSDELPTVINTRGVIIDALFGANPVGRVAVGNESFGEDKPTSGFVISGVIDSLRASDALNVLERYQRYSEHYPSVGQDVPIRIDGFELGELLFDEAYIPELVIDGHSQDEDWFAAITSEHLGLLAEWRGEAKPLVLNFEHLHYPFLSLPEARRPDVIAPLVPGDIVAADVAIASLYLEGEDYGSWQFSVVPNSSEVTVNNLVADVKGLKLSSGEAGFRWSENDGIHQSVIALTAQADNVRDVFKAFDLEPMLTSNQGVATIAVSWPDAPYKFDSLQLSGGISMQLTDGQFLRTEGAPTGLLKLLGVFNFDNLIRRMRLDFGDLVNEGLSYDSFTTDMKLTPGQVVLEPPLSIEGPSSDFSLSATLDTRAQTIDGDLVAVVPVSRNLPWVAAIAGGLPAAAGLYVASRVFSDSFDRLSSASYSIKGPWSDLDIKFERLFEASGKSSAVDDTKTPSSQGTEH